jgi:hypothetical protein
MCGDRQKVFKRAEFLAATLHRLHLVGHRGRVRIEWRLRSQPGMCAVSPFFVCSLSRLLHLCYQQARDLAPRLVTFLGGWGLGVFR